MVAMGDVDYWIIICTKFVRDDDTLKPITDARETRRRNSHEKYLAASRYDIRTSFSREFLVCVSWGLVPSCFRQTGEMWHVRRD